eukprot:CAMPEP_0176201732 /NCGR_PEP_ID=MMETSP0121_2-20121125/9717_1 /TAXON_ID=160619 /ORGANISM="Kryptoperidinium foliaceum, Strain CCMP 1326" /LENGTH=156 /DNA_ID=CAMNT_0017540617 /DNA_START=63 /DNA_END=529 /DNA_ORIENTATION=-
MARVAALVAAFLVGGVGDDVEARAMQRVGAGRALREVVPPPAGLHYRDALPGGVHELAGRLRRVVRREGGWDAVPADHLPEGVGCGDEARVHGRLLPYLLGAGPRGEPRPPHGPREPRRGAARAPGADDLQRRPVLRAAVRRGLRQGLPAGRLLLL